MIISLGIPNDYKPWLVPLKNGQLLLVAFCFGPYPGVDGYCERAVFWRSDDGGQTWGPRQERLDIHGREFSPHVLHDGTLLMPCHFLSTDQFNKKGHTYAKVFRSTDHGATWSEQEIGPEGFPPGANTATDWSVFQLPTRNPDQWLTCFGVSMQHGEQMAPEVVRLWRSSDSGKTTDGHGLGLRAIISDDDGETWNFKKDRIVISYVNSGASGGGFGNTLQLSDGTLVSAYSYRDEKEKTHIETVRWQLPDTP